MAAPVTRHPRFDEALAVLSEIPVGTPFTTYEAAELLHLRMKLPLMYCQGLASNVTRYASEIALPSCPDGPQLGRRGKRFPPRGGRTAWVFYYGE